MVNLVVKIKVPVRWFCKNIWYEIKIGVNAEICSIDRGWVCDCGEWIKSNDQNHKVSKWGLIDAE